MSIKQRIDAQTDALSALLTYANDATQAGDTDIGEAIRTLVDGYGTGGESSILLGEGDVTPTVENYGITFGDNIDLPQDKSIAYVIYDDGTSGAVSGKTYMIAYAYGYLDKDLFEWRQESATYTNRLCPKMRFPLKFNDGDIPAWSDSQTYAQSGGAVIRSSSGTFYTGLGYGALRYNLDSKNFTISRGNSAYSFTPNRTYHYKVYAIGDSTGGGSGGSDVNTVFLGELANNANYGELMTALPPIKAKWKKSYFCVYACDGESSTGIQYRWNGLWLVHDETTVLYGQQSYVSNNLPVFSFAYGFVTMLQGRVPAMQNMTEASKFVFTNEGVLDTSLFGTTSSSRFARGDKLYLVEYRMDNSDEY